MTNVQAKRALLLQLQEVRRYSDELASTAVEFLTDEEVAVLHARGDLGYQRVNDLDERIEETNPVVEVSE